MAEVGFELLKTLAVLTAGRSPVFTSQGDTLAPTDPPSGPADGVDLDNSIIAVLALQLREDASSQVAVVTIDTPTDVNTFRVTLNAVDHDYAANPSDTIVEIVAGLKVAIETPAVFSADIQPDNTIKITKDSDTADFTIATSIAAGPPGAAISHVQEASTVDFELWLLPKGQTSWHRVQNLSDFGSAWRTVDKNWTERIQVAGYDRAFIQITSTDGKVIPKIGPCKEETS